MSDKLFFTVITVADELNAYKVFETLNARGVRLSATDLLKNWLFSVLARGETRQQNPQQASARGERASQQLKKLVQQMQGSRPDERRRAIGDLQMEARQLAEAERRLGNEASRAGAGRAGEDARRRLAADQERLAERTDRLQESARQMAASPIQTDGKDWQAMSDASQEIAKQKLGERMRQSAQAMRESGPSEAAALNPEQLARRN